MKLYQQPITQVLSLGCLLDVEGEPKYKSSVTITFDCAIPTKKNKLRPSGSKRLHYDRTLKDQLRSLETLARVQWGARQPILHPDLHFHIEAAMIQDRDGMVTTLLDALVKARVIPDDRIGICNGINVVYPAKKIATGSRAKVQIDWKEVG